MNMKGFTLVELMVVVGIIGIIAAIAYPSYQGYIRDTYHAQALSDLKLCGLQMERFYSNGFSYVGGEANCNLWSPSDRPAGDAQYTFTFPGGTNPSAQDYTIRATPVGGACPCIELEADGTVTNIP